MKIAYVGKDGNMRVMEYPDNVWFETENGFASRPATPLDRKRRQAETEEVFGMKEKAE